MAKDEEKREGKTYEPIVKAGPFDYVGKVGVSHPTEPDFKFKVVTKGPKDEKDFFQFYKEAYDWGLAEICHAVGGQLNTRPQYPKTVTDADGKLTVTDHKEIHKAYQRAMDEYKPGRPTGTSVQAVTKRQASQFETLAEQAGLDPKTATPEEVIAAYKKMK